MNNKYLGIFNQLWNHAENEIVEFKKAEHSFDIDELGKYFSALSNEANLRERECGWLLASLGRKGLLERDIHGKNWFITALGEQELRLKP